MARMVKQDSNITGLRYCQEVNLGALDTGTPANQRWVELEPNTYSDFGGSVTTVARNPINPSRQRKKGVVTNVEASASFDSDLTQNNMQDVLQGFFFADMRFKNRFIGAITADASDDAFDATGIHTGFFVGDLIMAAGFVNAANNGVHLVDTVNTDTVEVTSDLVNEGPVSGARIECIGFQFTTGDATIAAPGGGALPTLVTSSKDLSQLGLVPGEWIFVGGDAATTQFALNAPFWARIRAIAQNAITFDKATVALATDDGTSTGSGGTNNKTIRLFRGRVLKNELGTSIKRRTYTLERTLGFSDDSNPALEQAEYVVGAVPNEFTINAASADKLTCDLSFVGIRAEAIDEFVTGTLKSKVGSVVRVPVIEADAFNTSSDVSRIRLSIVSNTNVLPAPLFTYAENVTVTINNNNSPNNAVGVLGAFEVTAGTFEVGGDVNAYFGDVAAIQAVQSNADVTMDIIFVKAGAGIVVDVPLITLGGGQPDVAADEPVMIPLESPAATGAKVHPNLNHTLLLAFFEFLPNVAG